MIYITVLRTQQLMSRTSFVKWRISNFYLYSTSCVWNSNSPLLLFVSNCCNSVCEKRHVKITWRINRIAVFSETISRNIKDDYPIIFSPFFSLSFSLHSHILQWLCSRINHTCMSRAKCAIIVFAISRRSLMIEANYI